jgi:hypothetical protein
MNFVMHLKSAGVISSYWTEQELKSDRVLAIRMLGGDPEKLPDLVFDLKTDEGSIRTAVEVERTRKAQRRYKTIQWSYYRLKGIKLILFGVDGSATETAIRGEFDGAGFASEHRAVGYFTLADFLSAGVDAELRIRGKRSAMEAFFKRLCGSQWKREKKEELKEISVPFKSDTDKVPA